MNFVSQSAPRRQLLPCDKNGGSFNAPSDSGCYNKSRFIPIQFGRNNFREGRSGVAFECVETRYVYVFFCSGMLYTDGMFTRGSIAELSNEDMHYIYFQHIMFSCFVLSQLLLVTLLFSYIYIYYFKYSASMEYADSELHTAYYRYVLIEWIALLQIVLKFNLASNQC